MAALAGFIFLALLVWLGATALHAKGQLDQLRAQLPALQQGLLSGDDVTPQIATASRHAQIAYDDTHDPLWAAASAVPVLGQPFATVRGLTEATRAVVVDAATPLAQAVGEVKPQTLLRSGSLDVTSLRAAAVPLASAAVIIDQQRSALDDLPGSWIPQVSSAREELATSVDTLASTTVTSATAARLLPGMLGADGERRWFVVFQNTAEARGTGGLLGAYMTLVAKDGKITVEKSGEHGSLPAFTSVPEGVSQEFYDQYSGVGGTDLWVNANLSPDFPEAASVWASMWKAGTGETVNGVIALDPKALAGILAATGPVEVSGVGKVDASNLEELVLRRQYVMEPDPDKRKQIMVGVGTRTIEALLRGKADFRTLAENLAKVTPQRHVMVWSAVEGEQNLLDVNTVAGGVDYSDEPFAQAVVVNAGGNKLDAWLHQDLTYRVVQCSSTGRTVQISVKMRNDAPKSGLPEYVTVRSDKPTYATVPGQSRVELQVLTTLGSVLKEANLDGVPVTVASPDGTLPDTLPDSADETLFVQQSTEAGRPTFGMNVELLPAGGTKTLTLTIEEPASSEPPQLPLQPMANDPSAKLVGTTC